MACWNCNKKYGLSHHAVGKTGAAVLLGTKRRAESAPFHFLPSLLFFLLLLTGGRPVQSLPELLALQLVDTRGTSLDNVVADLRPNQPIDIGRVKFDPSNGRGLTIVARSSPDTDTVGFYFLGHYVNTTYPFVMCGFDNFADIESGPTPCSVLTIGTHTVTATPFSTRDGPGAPWTVTFSLFEEFKKGTKPPVMEDIMLGAHAPAPSEVAANGSISVLSSGTTTTRARAAAAWSFLRMTMALFLPLRIVAGAWLC
jgi:hypothetical protein